MFFSLKRIVGLLILGFVALLTVSFAILIRAIRRAPSGYETPDGFFLGKLPAPAGPASAMTPAHYHRLLTGIDSLLQIFQEPGTELTPEDHELQEKLTLARAYSSRAESAHPFSTHTLADGASGRLPNPKP